MKQWICILILSGSLATRMSGAPYRPASDDEVIEILPRGASSLARERTSPGKPSSLTVARESFRLGQLHSEPRYVRVAESIVSSVAPGPERCLMEGLVQQYFHQFEQAQAKFEEGLKLAPRDPELLLQLAMLHTVQGRYRDARETISRSPSLLGTLRGVTVLAIVSSLNGQLDESFALLKGQFSRAKLSGPEGAWVASTLAEMATRKGDVQMAENYLNQARTLEPESVPLLIQMLDLLIQQKRYPEVLSLTKGSSEENQMILLRRAIASKNCASGAAEFAHIKIDLESRLAGNLHLREQALFQLLVKDQHISALDTALRNFDQQREPIDAWLVLESAHRGGIYDRATPVLQWVAETHLEDASIRSLLPFFKKGG